MKREDAHFLYFLSRGISHGKLLYFDTYWYKEGEDKFKYHWTRIKDVEDCSAFEAATEKIGEVFHVHVWKDENSSFRIGRANDKWFLCSKKLEKNVNISSWASSLLQSSYVPSVYKEDLELYASRLPDGKLLTALFGDPFPVAKWGNPKGKIWMLDVETHLFDDVARELAEFYYYVGPVVI